MGAAVLPIIAVSTAVAAYSQIRAGEAAKDQADYQAEVAQQNAVRARNEADQAIIRGEISEQQHRQKINLAIGRERASAAARGVLVDQGSALDLTQNLGTIGEIDAQQIRRNALMESTSMLDRSSQFKGESGLLKATGTNARTSGYINATSSLLTGAAQVADKWYKPAGTT